MMHRLFYLANGCAGILNVHSILTSMLACHRLPLPCKFNINQYGLRLPMCFLLQALVMDENSLRLSVGLTTGFLEPV